VFAIHAYMGELLLVKAFLIIVLGGLGSLPGAIVGGLILGFLESFGMTYLGYYSQPLVFVLVIVILLFRPTGLFGGIVFQIR
jgi:branched-chain amino acid transport system permease protein